MKCKSIYHKEYGDGNTELVCKICSAGVMCGPFRHMCSNPQCIEHDSALMKLCAFCGIKKIDCSC